MELTLETLLDAEFSDVLGAPVVGLIFVILDLRFFGLIDPADVSNDMACQGSVRVAAKQARLDIHPGESKTLRRKTCHFRVGQPRANRQRLKALRLLHQLLESPAIARADIHDLREIFQCLL